MSLVMNISSQGSDNGAFQEDKFNEVVEHLEKAYAEGGSPPFAGDLENETYKGIL